MIHSFRTHRRVIAASALLLAMVFILTSFSMTGSDAETYTVQQGDFQYTLLEDRTAIVNDYIGSASEVTIPNRITYGGTSYTVTSVSINAFYGCYTVKKVTLPSTLQSIGESAFHNCVNLETITISSSNQYFKVVDGVLFSKDGSVLYAYPAMKTVTDYYLPDGVERIGNFAFSHVRSLRILVMNEGLESIGRSITSCPGLEVIHIPSTVSSIEVPFADSCLSLTTVFVNMYNQHYRSVDGVLFTTDMSTLIRFPASHSTSYVVPEGVKVLAHSSMDHNHLESLTLPSTLEEIGRASFYISDLTSIVIPESVKSIGWFAFGYTYISEITFMGVPSYIEDRLFISVHVDTVTEYYAKVKVPLEEHVPDGVIVEYVDIGSGEDPGHLDLYDVTIGDLTYDLSSDGTAEVSGLHNSIGSVIIPGTVWYLDQDYTVTRIGNEAFMDSSITSVSIPDTVTIIGALAFQYCESLKIVDMGSGVEYIGDSAFNNCRSLKSFPLPDSLNEMIGNPFAGCISIDRFTISDSNRYFKTIDGVLFSEDGSRLIAYPVANGLTSYIVPDDTRVLGSMSFTMTRFSDIRLNDGLVSMEEACFYTDSRMDVLKIPSSVTNIEPFLIMGLKRVDVSGGNTHYVSVDGALYTSDMTRLIFMPDKGDVVCIIPEGVREIGTVSMSTNSFSSVLLPSTLEVICDFAFQFSQVDKVIVPDSSVVIGEGAFFMSNLTEIVFLGVPESIGSYAFQSYVGNITEYHLKAKVPLEKYVGSNTTVTYEKYVPDGVSVGEIYSMGDLSYKVCTDGSYYAEVYSYNGDGRNVTIPGSIVCNGVSLPVLSIGDGAFAQSSIVGVGLPDGLLHIGNMSFYQCVNLEGTLVIPSSVISIGEYAFAGDSIRIIVFEGSTEVQYAAFKDNPLDMIKFLANMYVPFQDDSLFPTKMGSSFDHWALMDDPDVPVDVYGRPFNAGDVLIAVYGVSEREVLDIRLDLSGLESVYYVNQYPLIDSVDFYAVYTDGSEELVQPEHIQFSYSGFTSPGVGHVDVKVVLDGITYSDGFDVTVISATGNMVTVTFVVMGNVVNMMKLEQGAVLVVAPADPVVEGLKFLHWSQEEGGNPYPFGRAIFSDITIHAVFAPIIIADPSDIVVTTSVSGGSVHISVIPTGLSTVPPGTEVDVVFTALKKATVLGKEIIAPTTVHRTITVPHDVVTHYTETIELADVIGNNISLIGVVSDIDGYSYGNISLDYRGVA